MSGRKGVVSILRKLSDEVPEGIDKRGSYAGRNPQLVLLPNPITEDKLPTLNCIRINLGNTKKSTLSFTNPIDGAPNVLKRGYAFAAYGHQVVLVGGHTDADMRVHVMDTTTGEWTVGPEVSARTGMAWGVIENCLYLAGGCKEDGTPVNAVDIYDMETGELWPGPVMPTAVKSDVHFTYKGRLRLRGWGSDGVKKLLCFDPKRNEWQTDKWLDKTLKRIPRNPRAVFSLSGEDLFMASVDMSSKMALIRKLEAATCKWERWFGMFDIDIGKCRCKEYGGDGGRCVKMVTAGQGLCVLLHASNVESAGNLDLLSPGDVSDVPPGGFVDVPFKYGCISEVSVPCPSQWSPLFLQSL